VSTYKEHICAHVRPTMQMTVTADDSVVLLKASGYEPVIGTPEGPSPGSHLRQRLPNVTKMRWQVLRNSAGRSARGD
jgi:hypothetical protein